ncbi:aminopeptidase [Brevibacillus agri]|uniref:aminopeptidase n=1 Tax=Brevibacillus TaxID=55080 RepID=UPI00027165BA|nr:MULTISPECIES: aminopeptidase [Brevibacillus]ELK39710.1 aminopeptidase AmpS [Brevibacillus agri BAB-2500]EJL42923.1 leucyl aminopeptidase (aminopeptidase T) [Brevibacillus sp. CF112]MCG5252148.1 aminopeptidase [Brevibacillus agri]MDR9503752.1 aminopeptidase [Brevibacillus agri]MED1646364.1 aminopeptidase [Brevibacillus agri]
MSFELLFDRYADLAVKVGVNVQPMQTLVVTAPLSAAPFVRKVARKAYEAGAKHVHIDWTDDELTRMKYDLAPDEAFADYPQWKAKGLEEMAENGAAFLYINSTNPDLLKGVKLERIATANKAAGQALRTFRNYTMSDKVSWSVIAVPSPEWAAMVFPDLPADEQVPALWDAIFRATRVDTDDPVQAWHEHHATLNSKVEQLNAKQYRYLHYEAPGTQLTIELPDRHIWIGGGSVNEKGAAFMANMPTEEVFTAPKKDGVNGTVRSTKPLSYHGNVIENFTLTFEQGKIVSVSAEKGEEALKQLVATDEGSHYLGEVALVPHQSPISLSNIIFYNTLFDENASNHLAIGSAYSVNIEGGAAMSQEELAARGINTSLVHVDFMIGSAEMNIDGETADGVREPLFRNGNWA